MDQSIEYGVNMSKLIDDVNAKDNQNIEDSDDIENSENIDDSEE